jgi:hypothetical protein
VITSYQHHLLPATKFTTNELASSLYSTGELALPGGGRLGDALGDAVAAGARRRAAPWETKNAPSSLAPPHRASQGSPVWARRAWLARAARHAGTRNSPIRKSTASLWASAYSTRLERLSTSSFSCGLPAVDVGFASGAAIMDAIAAAGARLVCLIYDGYDDDG